jgi:DNA-binding phage protein
MNEGRKVKNGIPWRERFNERLQNPDYAREYILAAIEDGDDLHAALADVVRAVGATRYSTWAKEIHRPNLLRAIRKGANPTLKTIDRLLAPLGLRLAVVRA